MNALKNWLRDWLDISPLEKRQTGTEEVINHLVVHLTEARDNIDKLAEIILVQSGVVKNDEPKPTQKKTKSNGK